MQLLSSAWPGLGGGVVVPQAAHLAALVPAASLRTAAYGPAARGSVLQWAVPSEQLRFLRQAGMRLLQHETAVRDKLTGGGSAGHGPGHHLPLGHVPRRIAEPGRPVVELADAEECDEALEDYQETRKRVRALSRGPPGHVPLAARLRGAVDATRHGAVATIKFLVSVPGRLQRFAGLPKADRRATYARWWGVIKKEAKHYWVRQSVNCAGPGRGGAGRPRAALGPMDPGAVPAPLAPPPPPPPPALQVGTKLLAADVKIASRLVKRVLQGRTLSRRERNQLTRTVADIFRLVRGWDRGPCVCVLLFGGHFQSAAHAVRGWYRLAASAGVQARGVAGAGCKPLGGRGSAGAPADVGMRGRRRCAPTHPPTHPPPPPPPPPPTHPPLVRCPWPCLSWCLSWSCCCRWAGTGGAWDGCARRSPAPALDPSDFHPLHSTSSCSLLTPAPPGGPQALPKHAALHLRGQAEEGGGDEAAHCRAPRDCALPAGARWSREGEGGGLGLRAACWRTTCGPGWARSGGQMCQRPGAASRPAASLPPPH